MNRPFVFIGGIFSMRWIREHKIVSFLLVVIVLALGFIVFAAVTGGDGGIVSSLTAETAPSDPGETEGYVSFSSEG